MIRRGILCSILLVLTLAGLRGGEFTDGLWNGKSWDTELLEKGVAGGDPDALAEWSYCAELAWKEFVYEPAIIFGRAREAAEKGSLLGRVMLARCHLWGIGIERDEEAGLLLMREAAKAGHPAALADLGGYDLRERGGVLRNAKKGEALLKEAIDLGSVDARVRRLFYEYESQPAEVRDHQAVAKEAALLLGENESLGAAWMILQLSVEQVALPFLDAEIKKRAYELTKMAAEAGQLDSVTRLGVFYVKSGEANRGLPLILEGAATPSSYRSAIALEYSLGSQASKQANSAAAIGTVYQLARAAFGQGNEQLKIARLVARSYLTEWGSVKEDPAMALPAIEILKVGRGRADRELIGAFYLADETGEFYRPARGLANFVYAAGEGSYGLARLGRLYSREGAETFDRARAYATLVRGIELNAEDGPWLREAGEKMRGAMGPAELAEAVDLAERNYPAAEEFQVKAIRELIDYGDLPPGSTLENAEP